MATDLERLLVRVEANLSQYEKEMAKARNVSVRELRSIEREVQGSASRIESAMARMGGTLKSFGAGALAGVSLQAIATAAQSAIKSIADIGDAADKLGLTTDEYQQLAFAAQLADVETSTLAAGMKKLAVNSSDAARGSGELGKILALNNVSITDANGKLLSQTEILSRVAELVRNAASEQDQLAIAQAAFGKSGGELMLLLQDGAAGVAAAMGRAKEETVQFTEQQIRKAQEFDDKIETLINTISVGLKGAFIDLAPEVAGFVSTSIQEFEALGEFVSRVSEFVRGIGGATVSAPGKGSLTGATARGLKVQPSDSSFLSGSVDTLIKDKVRSTILKNEDEKRPAEEARRRAEQLAAQRKREAERLAEQAKREAAAKAKAIQDVILNLQFEHEQMKRTDLQQEISNELRRAGVSATSAYGREITAIVTKNFELEASEKFVAAAQEQRIESAEALRDAQMELAGTLVDALDAAIIQGQKADDVFKNLVKTLASSALRGLLMGQGPFGTLFGTAAGGGIFGSLFGGFRAAGGPVSAGKSYVVGERGPEIFRPSGSGSIVPNHRVGGASLTFAPVVYAQGADSAAVARLQTQLYTMQRDFKSQVLSVIGRERNLNAGFAT
jgi:hypothetical protein